MKWFCLSFFSMSFLKSFYSSLLNGKLYKFLIMSWWPFLISFHCYDRWLVIFLPTSHLRGGLNVNHPLMMDPTIYKCSMVGSLAWTLGLVLIWLILMVKILCFPSWSAHVLLSFCLQNMLQITTSIGILESLSLTFYPSRYKKDMRVKWFYLS